VYIYDFCGRLVSEKLNLENLPLGIYLVKIMTTGKNYFEKIIKKQE